MYEVMESRSQDEGFAEASAGGFVSHFRDLNVYNEAFALSVQLHKLSQSFPNEEKFALTDQLRRCTKGVCANIAEGFGSQQYSRPEFNRFIMLALGSCYEAQVWLDYCKELQYITGADWQTFNNGYDKVQRMLYKLRGSVAS